MDRIICAVVGFLMAWLCGWGGIRLFQILGEFDLFWAIPMAIISVVLCAAACIGLVMILFSVSPDFEEKLSDTYFEDDDLDDEEDEEAEEDA